MDVGRNLAEEYAQTFGLPKKTDTETAAMFRERVAWSLHAMGEPVYAHEALYNARMSDDPFAHGSLDRGYGPRFVTQIAQYIEASYQKEQRHAARQQRKAKRPRWLRWLP